MFRVKKIIVSRIYLSQSCYLDHLLIDDVELSKQNINNGRCFLESALCGSSVVVTPGAKSNGVLVNFTAL